MPASCSSNHLAMGVDSSSVAPSLSPPAETHLEAQPAEDRWPLHRTAILAAFLSFTLWIALFKAIRLLLE
jgi:hypothetical protein